MTVVTLPGRLVGVEQHAYDASIGGRPGHLSCTLPALTGLRGVAAMAVFLCHLQIVFMQIIGVDARSGPNLFGQGFRGVDLFFILSGFILFHTHSEDFKRLELTGITRFYILRFFRVYPLNTLVIFILICITSIAPHYVDWHRLNSLSQGAYHLKDYSYPSLIQSLFLAQTWTFAKLGTWNEPAWTLSAEVFGYLLFPVMARVVASQRNGTLAMAAALCCLSMLVIALIVAGHANGNPSGSFGLIRMLFCFACGIFLCRFAQLRPINLTRPSTLTLASTVFVLVVFACPRLGVLSVFGFAGLILGLSYRSGPINEFMSRRPVMFLGRISFSFYLMHLIPLDLLCWFLRDVHPETTLTVRLVALVAVVCMIFLSAMLSHKYLEVAFQRLGRTLASKLAAERDTVNL